jgi:hypothetical protein
MSVNANNSKRKNAEQEDDCGEPEEHAKRLKTCLKKPGFFLTKITNQVNDETKISDTFLNGSVNLNG